LLFNFNEARLKDGIKSVILGAGAASVPSNPPTEKE
jgi:hypothetical protein